MAGTAAGAATRVPPVADLVGIVVVSHSRPPARPLARAAVELALEMAPDLTPLISDQGAIPSASAEHTHA